MTLAGMHNPAADQETPATPAQDAKPVQEARPARYVEKEFYVPMMNAMPRGLDVLEVYIDLPGRHPLVVLTRSEEHTSELQSQ